MVDAAGAEFIEPVIKAYLVRHKDTKKPRWITLQMGEDAVWSLMTDTNQRGTVDEQIAHLKSYLYIVEIPLHLYME